MKQLSYVAVGVVLGAFAVSAGGRVTTQDAVTLSPQYYVVRFENDRVRVLEFHMKPGEKEALHFLQYLSFLLAIRFYLLIHSCITPSSSN